MRAIKESYHKTNKKMKRGQKEAISLRRRRLIKVIVRGGSVLGVCLMVISTIYLWQSGKIVRWFDNAEVTVEDSLIEAGLTIEEIQINGHKQTQLEDIKTAIDIEQGSSLLAVNIKAVKDRVERLAWVKTATITRKLPESLIVKITEHNPAALWQVDQKIWVLSDQGIKITDQKLILFSELPMISGAGADIELENLLSVGRQNNEIFNRVETASWIGNRRWDLILKNGIKIMLPEKEMAQAWTNLVALDVREKLLARNILIVDFRLSDKTVIRLTPEEALRRQLLAKTGGVGEEI